MSLCIPLSFHRAVRTNGLLTLILVAATASGAAARTYPEPLGLSDPQLAPISAIDQVTLPALDLDKLLDEDRSAAMKDQPLRFAVPQPIYRGLGRGGLWETTADGRSVWRLVIQANEAAGIVPVFDRFYLPAGAELHVYAADGSQRVRPYTSADNRAERELWVPMVGSDTIVVELILPKGTERDQAQLHISQIGQAYRDLWGRQTVDKSGSCNVDVACQLGDDWADEVRAVARLQINFSLCTGFLVANTVDDDRPLLMTANHCSISASNDQNVLAFWNYQNTSCRPPGSTQSGADGDGVLDEFTTGTTLLAADSRSDFTITELSESPAPFDVYLLGWDARKLAPASAVTIHHPLGDEKRISRELDQTSFDIYPDPGVLADTDSHIRIDDWDEGTTQGGSSGSPLFDETTHRVVGQLHGGLAACGNDDPDWYGAMWRSFELGIADVLDPGATGAQFLDGRDFGDAPDDPGDPPDEPGEVEPFECVEDASTLCLNGGRFQVRAEWMDFFGQASDGRAVTTHGGDSGMFWFFTEDNLELLVKVLDACDAYDHFWVFAAGATNVEYRLTVIDSQTGHVRRYENPLGMPADAVTDTSAFATCP